MSEKSTHNRGTRMAVRRLLEAIDRALTAVRELERARTALAREADGSGFRVITPEEEQHAD
jgi:hypothetical protein